MSCSGNEGGYVVGGPGSYPRALDEEETVLKGPICNWEKRYGEGQITKVAIDDIILKIGTPIVCRGLKNAAHLNGKIGDVRDSKAGRYVVRFEDKSLQPVSVKPINLRILFDLPDE